MLYSPSRRLRSAARSWRSFWMSVCSAMRMLPGHRKVRRSETTSAAARAPGVRQRAIVDEHLAGVQASDDLKQRAQPQRVGRIEARAMPQGGSAANLAILGRGAGELHRPGVVRPVERRKLQRDRERPRAAFRRALRPARDPGSPARRRSAAPAARDTARNARADGSPAHRPQEARCRQAHGGRQAS